MTCQVCPTWHVTRGLSVASLVVIILTRMDYLHSWIYRELSLTLDSLVTHSTRIAIEEKNKQKQILMSQHSEICLQLSSDWCKTDSNWLSESPQNKIFYWCFSQLYIFLVIAGGGTGSHWRIVEDWSMANVILALAKISSIDTSAGGGSTTHICSRSSSFTFPEIYKRIMYQSVFSSLHCPSLAYPNSLNSPSFNAAIMKKVNKDKVLWMFPFETTSWDFPC